MQDEAPAATPGPRLSQLQATPIASRRVTRRSLPRVALLLCLPLALTGCEVAEVTVGADPDGQHVSGIRAPQVQLTVPSRLPMLRPSPPGVPLDVYAADRP